MLTSLGKKNSVFPKKRGQTAACFLTAAVLKAKEGSGSYFVLLTMIWGYCMAIPVSHRAHQYKKLLVFPFHPLFFWAVFLIGYQQQISKCIIIPFSKGYMFKIWPSVKKTLNAYNFLLKGLTRVMVHSEIKFSGKGKIIIMRQLFFYNDHFNNTTLVLRTF